MGHPCNGSLYCHKRGNRNLNLIQNFTSLFNILLRSRIQSRIPPCIWLFYFLGLFKSWPFLSLSWTLTTDVVRNLAQISPNPGFIWCFCMIKWRLWTSSKNITRVVLYVFSVHHYQGGTWYWYDLLFNIANPPHVVR